MRVRRMIPYPITAIILFTAATSYAQGTSWLKRSWEGKAYTLGSEPQHYDLILNISSIKGKNFEGLIKAIQPQDTSDHFDSKITGVIFDRYLRINIGPWKVKCGSCKPQVLEFSMESGRFFMKGEAKGCSTVECTWITEFSEPLVKFNTTEQDMLFAMADEVKAPELDTTAVVQNTPPPVKDTVTAAKEISPPPPARITLLPSGNIVAFERNTASLLSQKTPTNLRKKLSLNLPQTTAPAPKITVLPAGDVALTGHKSDISFSPKPPASLNKTTWMVIPETTPPPPKISVLPAGDIVSLGHTSATSLSQPPGSLQKNTSITIDETTPPSPRVNVLPAGNIVSSDHAANTNNAPTLGNKNVSLKVKENVVITKPAPPKDTAVALPTDYTERKKNVIRTLIVNTDSIMLRVYDNGVVDGDIVSVIYNDKVVVDKLSLNKNAVVVKIPVKKSGINTLVFHAHNLGEFPPNTALLEILYDNKREELTVSSDLTVSSTIDIEYQP